MSARHERRIAWMTLIATCCDCGKDVEIPVHMNDWLEWRDRHKHRAESKSVQDQFPYLNADMREMLISRTCPTCWDELFKGGDNE